MGLKKLLNHLLAFLLIACLLLSLDADISSGVAGTTTPALRTDQEEEGLQFIDQVLIRTETPVLDGVHHVRMEIEVDDYPGSGANSRHDPKSPGKP